MTLRSRFGQLADFGFASHQQLVAVANSRVAVAAGREERARDGGRGERGGEPPSNIHSASSATIRA